jgi:phosphatidyl-myo-inositol dimannoside synthase
MVNDRPQAIAPKSINWGILGETTCSVKPMARHVFVFLEIFSCEGGIQSYVRDILRAYPAADQADVFLLRDGPQDCAQVWGEFGDQLRFHPLKTAGAKGPMVSDRPSVIGAHLGRLRLATNLLTYLLAKRPDRVFCGHINLASLVQTLCQPLGIPYTVLTYGKEVWSSLPMAQQRALRAADRIWTISRYSRDRMCEANRVGADRVDFLYCAVDGETFRPGEKSPELVKRYQLAGHKVLLTVARLWSGDPYKGVDVTIRALPEIARAQPTVKYLVVGRGDDQPRLARLAEDLGVADRVIFAGFVPTIELPQHYHLADGYVMPSQEGFGIVYLEAMACGVPVIAGDADGSADPLQDGRLGWQVAHRDSEAVAAACVALLGGADRRCDGGWLREQVMGGFGRSALAQQLEALLHASAEPHPQPLSFVRRGGQE